MGTCGKGARLDSIYSVPLHIDDVSISVSTFYWYFIWMHEIWVKLKLCRYWGEYFVNRAVIRDIGDALWNSWAIGVGGPGLLGQLAGGLGCFVVV